MVHTVWDELAGTGAQPQAAKKDTIDVVDVNASCAMVMEALYGSVSQPAIAAAWGGKTVSAGPARLRDELS
ncbi:unnamed protein product [Clonostachys rhizophaga]|uniref:Uncharacterized protein n=1 Tax=Clonostachys rhizophaga TaxID=160324 RepID=A0A9N9V526_9HYPO|nr:unnamed protein product [Clonostachys rhizophaga]